MSLIKISSSLSKNGVAFAIAIFYCLHVQAQQAANLDSLKVWLGQSTHYYDNGDYAQSAKLARTCIETAEKQGIKGISGQAYYLLAKGAFQLQDYPTGVQYAREVMRTGKAEANSNDIGNAFNVMAILMLATNQLDSAYYFGEQAVRYYQQAGNMEGVAIANTKIGHVFNIKGEYAKATPYYLRSYEVSKTDTLSAAFMTANLCLASNYIFLKKADAALFHTQASYRIAKVRGSFYDQSMALQYFSGIYEMKGDLAKALQYGWQYAKIRDSVMRHEQIKLVKEMEVQYKAAEKENAIKLLEKDRSQQRAVIWAVLATLALLFLAVLRIYRSYQQRTRDNQQLTAVNTTLTAEKIETERQLEEEARERERLNEMDAFKSRFFTNITHEFRTPLTVVLGITGQLQSQLQTWAKEDAQQGVSGKLSLIKRNGENLLRLINQILDLAKLESNALKMNYVKGDVLAFLRYIAESMHSMANAQNIMLRVESAPGLSGQVIMDYDSEYLSHIVQNLLSNAIKFTPSGGRVILRLAVEPEAGGKAAALITVADSGVGIAQADLPFVFDRFFQARNQEHSKSGGAGIGLALTKELVRTMGGEISVESQEGHGTIFFVRLPITQNAQASDHFMALTPAPLPSTLPFEGRTIAPNAYSDERPTILVLEDNPDVVEYLMSSLAPYYTLDFAYNGRAGIEKALESIPDLIISDVMMPEKDGFEVCDTLKKDERSSHIPIVMLTARADVESRLTGLRRGADAYLAKPFVEEELLIVTENLLELRRKLQSKYAKSALDNVPIEENASKEVAGVEDVENVFLKKAIAHIEAKIDDAEFGNEELARKMTMSESQLHRKIKALTQQSLSIFIRSVRLRQGRALLETTNLSISEVAYAVGYTDPAYFSRTFSAEFGFPPTSIRKQ
jgi:signal transduction histidine kinase/DNA-binding response OmpR family regulator